MRVAPPSSTRRGFTLIEVILALGVASVAILSMLALMPVGMSAMKDAADSSGRTQVLVHVSSVLKATPFSELPAYVDAHPTGTPLLFDRAGRLTDSAVTAAFGATFSQPSAPYPGAPASMTNSVLAVGVTIANLKPGTIEPLTSQRAVLIIPKS